MTRVPPITNDRCRPFEACSTQGARKPSPWP